MRNNKIFQITFCGIMTALSIVLERTLTLYVTDSIKITFYALPLMFTGIMFGVKYGVATGLVTGVVSQLMSPFGINLSSIFYALAPICWALFSALCNKLLIKTNRYIRYPITVLVASIMANLVNTFAMFMDSLLIKDSYYTFTKIILDWPGRLLTMMITFIPYVILIFIVCENFKEIIKLNNKSKL